MVFQQFGSAEPKYLAATDILIGDMSNINYEFLIYDRPIILLANKWVQENFPDIGIKTDIKGLRAAIASSIECPDEFKAQRRYWLDKTIYKPDGLSSKRYIDIILTRCGIETPNFEFIHNNNSVRKTNLSPLVKEANRRGISHQFLASCEQQKANTVYVAAHYRDLINIDIGYKVHIDHDLKGKATSNLEKAISDYQEHDYVPNIDLHIVAGDAGKEFTERVLGPNANRIIVGGYPKADDFVSLNAQESRQAVFKELGFDESQPLITYAPAAKESFRKPGGSLHPRVINELKKIADETNYNVLAKLKYQAHIQKPLLIRAIGWAKRQIIIRVQDKKLWQE